MNNNKRTAIITIALVTAIMGGLLFYVLKTAGTGGGSVTPGPTPINVVTDETLEEYRRIWDENHAINEDYIGEFFFDSGLLNVSFVQAKGVYNKKGELYKFYTENGTLVTDPTGYTGLDVYIWTNWKTGKYDYNDEGGSVFMEPRNDLDDQNLIIYGHHFSEWNDATRKKAFTPLEKLLEKKNYSANKYATIVLEHEIRHYELVAVYEFDATKDYFWDDYQYWRTEYNHDDYTATDDPNYYANYIEGVKKVCLYDTGVELTTNDRTLTLQTCISGHTGELYEIVVFKQIESKDY